MHWSLLHITQCLRERGDLFGKIWEVFGNNCFLGEVVISTCSGPRSGKTDPTSASFLEKGNRVQEKIAEEGGGLIRTVG